VLQGDAIHYYPDGSHEAFLHIGGNQSSVFYHMNGQKESEGIILKGYIYHGPWKGWLSNGKTGYEGSYVNGQRDGLWQWYDETGKLRTKQVFNLVWVDLNLLMSTSRPARVCPIRRRAQASVEQACLSRAACRLGGIPPRGAG